MADIESIFEPYISARTAVEYENAVTEVNRTGNSVTARRSGSGAPTAATVGAVGDLYTDTSSGGKLYRCTAASGGVYTWVEVGGGGGSAFVPYNVNLLDNADWGYGLVNQRGSASYIVSGKASTAKTHVIDRWDIIGNGGLSVSDGYIATTNATDLRQYMEILPAALYGKTVTASYELADGTIAYGTGAFPSIGGTGGVNVTLGRMKFTFGFETRDSATALCGADSTIIPYVHIQTLGGYNQYRRVRLELGNVCHMETTPPKNYAENLAVCQRYFISIGSVFTAFGFVSNGAKTYYMFVPIPAPLRSTPAVTLSGWRGRKTVSPGYLVYTGSAYTAPTTISVNYSPGATLVRITDTIDTAADENNQVAQYEFSGLEISAEL